MTLSAQITVVGLNELHQRLGDSTILVSELKKAEHDALVLVQTRAKSDAASFSSVLPQSVQLKADAGGLSGIVGSVAKTALSIHEGRKPGNAPSFEQIATWMQRKGIATGSAVGITSGRRRKISGSNADLLHDDAVIIAKRIGISGTKGHPFIIPAATSEKDKVSQRFNDAVYAAIKRVAGK